jgi:hypothetical protein
VFANNQMSPDTRNYLKQVDADPCFRVAEDGIWSLPARDCVPLSAQREMRGILMSGMEDSTFVADQPDADMRGDRVWLEMELADALRSGVMTNENMPPHGTFAIHFVGRRSRQRGHYGHLGGSPHVVVVDRVISVRRTGPYRYRDDLRYSDPP